MRRTIDPLPESKPERAIGYCTNVHAGKDLASTQAQLETHTLRVKKRIAPDRPMHLGLWLCNQTAEALIHDAKQLDGFKTWMQSNALIPMTMNGFPYGDFHEPVVKKKVYLPTWESDERCRYSMHLVDLLHAMLPKGLRGTISTLPLGWGQIQDSYDAWSPDQFIQARRHFEQVLNQLRALEDKHDRLIQLCIEPEPGCVLDSADDVVRFFDEYLKPLGDDATRYFTVCHDVCHSAVIFEDQITALKTYHEAGVSLGKMQVSSAVRAVFDRKNVEQKRETIHDLKAFHEPRYMHQTCVRQALDKAVQMYEDLSDALNHLAADDEQIEALTGEWRVHFHVPIHLSHVGQHSSLKTTQQDIHTAVKLMREQQQETHEEIETYAWNVLPAHHAPDELSTGIADELAWYLEQFTEPLL